MANNGRARIYASATDYLEIDGFFEPAPKLNLPGERIKDRLGLTHRIVPTDSNEMKRWRDTVTFRFDRNDCLLVNSLGMADPEDAGRRTLAEWFEHWIMDGDAQLFIFWEAQGRDSLGTSVLLKRYVSGRVDDYPEWLLGALTNLGNAPTMLEFTLVVDAEGTFTDFTDVTSAVARTTRP